MIGEILTGTFAAATFGYLVARHRHMKRQANLIENDKRILELAGVAKRAKQEGQNEPYWWQKFENEKFTKRTGKLPDTKDTLEAYLEQKKQELKSDEHMVYNDEARKKEKQEWEDSFKKKNNDLLKEMLLKQEKKKEEG